MAHSQMRYGVVLPGGTATEQLEVALLAESVGWDGVFVWEAAYGPDAWSMLAAMARSRQGCAGDAVGGARSNGAAVGGRPAA